jgi:hypothetical protein
MNQIQKGIAVLALGLAGAAISAAQVVAQGTDVHLKFMQKIDSRKAHVGDKVKLAVADAVRVNGKTVMPVGMPVTGVIEKVAHRDHFGKNATIRLVLNPVRVGNSMVTLEPRDKQSITGRRSDTAGAASAGGALVLGPIGLIGGYFVTGKPVKVQVGDPLLTSVSRTVAVR